MIDFSAGKSAAEPTIPPPTLVPSDSEQVWVARAELLEAARVGPLNLGRFTDEEIAVLERPAGRFPAPRPWLSARSAEQTQTALAVAQRGLAARNQFRATPGSEAGAYEIEIDRDLLALVSLRHLVSALIVAERHRDGDIEWYLLYPQADELWLGEQVTGNGIHAFALADTEHWVRLLSEWCGADDPGRRAPRYDVVVPPGSEQGRWPDPIGRCRTATIITRFDAVTGTDTPQESWSSMHTGSTGGYLGRPQVDGMRYSGAGEHDIRRHWRETLRVREGDQ